MTGKHSGLEETIRKLEALDLAGLKAQWVALGLGRPPALRSCDLQRRMLAFQIQAKVFGGLDTDTRRLLRNPQSKRTSTLQAGVRLVREWQGRTLDVVVVDGGYEFEGRRFKSLSAIATAVTGVKWNGPRFFGLSDKAAASG